MAQAGSNSDITSQPLIFHSAGFVFPDIDLELTFGTKLPVNIDEPVTVSCSWPKLPPSFRFDLVWQWLDNSQEEAEFVDIWYLTLQGVNVIRNSAVTYHVSSLTAYHIEAYDELFVSHDLDVPGRKHSIVFLRAKASTFRCQATMSHYKLRSSAKKLEVYCE